MKKRYIYSLLFAIPGLFIALIISLVVFGAGAGILWLFVFGDNPWPAAAEQTLPVIFALTFLIMWIGLMAVGYQTGKRLEKESALNTSHVLISMGLTAMFIMFILLQQWSIGNIGPKSDSIICGDFCAEKGYSGSGMPPPISGDRTCSCYDNSGNEALKVPLDSIDLNSSK